MTAFRIISADSSHLTGMARCHRRCFPEMFTCRMGRKFAEGFFRAYVDDPLGLAVVAVEEGSGEVVGVVAGGRRGIREDYLSRSLKWFLPRFMLKAVSDPVVFKALRKQFARRLGRGRKSRCAPATQPVQADQPLALLQATCVLPEARGTGAASGLMSEFIAQCRRAGFASVYLTVFTDNMRAISFYTKTGWSIARQDGRTTYMLHSLRE